MMSPKPARNWGHHSYGVPKTRAELGDIIPMASPSVRILESVDLNLETVRRVQYSFKPLVLITGEADVVPTRFVGAGGDGLEGGRAVGAVFKSYPDGAELEARRRDGAEGVGSVAAGFGLVKDFVVVVDLDDRAEDRGTDGAVVEKENALDVGSVGIAEVEIP